MSAVVGCILQQQHELAHRGFERAFAASREKSVQEPGNAAYTLLKTLTDNMCYYVSDGVSLMRQ